MNWKEKAMIRATVGCFFGIILMHLVSGIFEWVILQKQHKAQYQAQKAIYEMLQEQCRILGETQKVFAEISKAQAASTIPSNPTDSVVGMETDAVQETAAVNPDAVDSVPCCGDPTDLPPVVDPVSSKSEDANDPQTFEEAFEYKMEQSLAHMPEGMRSQMKDLFAEVDAFEASSGEAELAELERMKDGILESFKEHERILIPETTELELTEEERAAKEYGKERMPHFRAVSILMAQKRNSAIEKRIQKSRQVIRGHIYPLKR